MNKRHKPGSISRLKSWRKPRPKPTAGPGRKTEGAKRQLGGLGQKS